VFPEFVSDPVEHHAVFVRRLRRPLAKEAHELTELPRNGRHLGVRRDQCRQPLTARASFFQHRNPSHKTRHEGTRRQPGLEGRCQAGETVFTRHAQRQSNMRCRRRGDVVE
jgi:hypothetical protein